MDSWDLNAQLNILQTTSLGFMNYMKWDSMFTTQNDKCDEFGGEGIVLIY